MISIGAIYHLIPVLFNRAQMFSTKLINAHFWLATIGTVIYIVALWVNGIMQGLMWRAFNADGSLTYSFVESVEASYGGYVARTIGGAFFLAGMFLMAYNVYRTVSDDQADESQAKSAADAQTA
jgi:cytochrome c oxidase cbb3-type subunit 1